MLRLFRRKIIFEKWFRHFTVFGRGENNGQRKSFLIFGKRFTIFKTVNRFPKLNSSSLHARLISDRRNPVGPGVKQHPVVGIRPPADQIPVGTGRIWPKQPRSGRNPVKLSRRNPATVTGRCRILATFAKL